VVARLGRRRCGRTTALALAAALIAACGAQTATPSTGLPEATLPDPQATAFVTLDPDEMARRHRDGVALFDYDAGAPLEIEQDDDPFRARATYSAYELTYASPLGGRVPAFLLVPTADGPHPAMVVMHGLGNSKADAMLVGQRYAEAGAVVLIIDAPFAREGRRSEPPITFTPRDRDEHVQLVVDLRRAVDLLIERDDVDPDQLAFLGQSYGAMVGGLLAGVEDRIVAYALVVGDGGLVQHFTGPEDAAGPLWEMNSAEREKWLALMEPIESIYYVGHAAPAALLFQSGRLDHLVPIADADRFQAAGSEPKTVMWYDAGHGLSLQAECDAAVWLAEHIAIDPSAYARGCA
jgi:uncharacterized protein